MENYSFDELVAMLGPAKASTMMAQRAHTIQPKPQSTAPKTTKNLTTNFKFFPCVGEWLPIGEVVLMRGVFDKGCRD